MKVLIVDDEEILRIGLTKMIERIDLPIVVIGTANDGLQALEMIAEHEPNILLTDIRMPNMDGLELIDEIYTNQYNIRTIILSGYDDFDYARKAIRSGCSDYLVKPPNFTELSELFHSLYMEVSLELEKFMLESKRNEILNQNQILLQTDFLRTLIVKKRSAVNKEMIEQADHLGINLHSANYAVAILRSEKRGEINQKYTAAEWELLKYACLNITGEIINGAASFYDEQEQLVILLPDNYSFEESCEKLQETRRNLSHYLQLSFSAALSALCPLSAITEAYGDANRLLRLRWLRDKSVLVTFKEMIHYLTEDITPHLKQLGELQHCESLSELQMKLNHWLETVKLSGYTPQSLEKLKQELHMALIALIQKAPLKQMEHENGFHSSILLERLDYADSFADQLEPIHQIIEQLVEQQKAGSYQSQAVEKAIAYIQKHYNHPINLASISEHVHMNSTYFSVMFKKKFGIGVIEFLTDVRMEKAKKLLVETELKTYQIAEAVGYQDPAYFSNVFKRQFGITPHEYRNTSAINVTRNQ